MGGCKSCRCFVRIRTPWVNRRTQGISELIVKMQSAASYAPKETETGVAISQKAKKLLLVHLGMLYATTHKMFILVCNKIQSSQSKLFWDWRNRSIAVSASNVNGQLDFSSHEQHAQILHDVQILRCVMMGNQMQGECSETRRACRVWFLNHALCSWIFFV